MSIDELIEQSARVLCQIHKRDPEEPVQVPAELGTIVKPDGTSTAPLWKTVVPQITDYVLITEAVNTALRLRGAPAAAMPQGHGQVEQPFSDPLNQQPTA